MAKVILIVEDDPKSLILTRDLLQVSGFTTIEATDGKQGIELAKALKLSSCSRSSPAKLVKRFIGITSPPSVG